MTSRPIRLPAGLRFSARALALAAGLAACVGGALAHHGWGSYDANRVLRFTGRVAEVQWQNPHVLIRLPAEGQQWEVVLAPISRMEARGVRPEMLAAGAEVGVEGYQSTRHAHEMRAERIRVAGKSFEMR
jgi:hypothetical protein